MTGRTEYTCSKMSLAQGLCVLATATLLVGRAAGQAYPPAGIECGDEQTRVTICFPGSPTNATCTYSVISNYSPNNLAPNITQLPCPKAPIFGSPCASMPGSLYIAFGPCNADDVVPASTTDNSLSIADWLGVLGINSIEDLGGLYVRGYAFQANYQPVDNELLPDLHSFYNPSLDQLTSVNFFQVMVTGQQVPSLPWVSALPAGISILNSPDANFSNPPRFNSLSSISNVFRIAGCTKLTSLAGFESLREGAESTKMEVLANFFLADISALSDFYKCLPDGTTLMDPDIVIGIFAMHPVPLQAGNGGCTLNTPRQICQYIAASDRCPPGTEYVRYADNTIQHVPSTIPGGPSISPAQPPPLPAPAPLS